MNNPQPVLFMILFLAIQGINAQTANVNATAETKICYYIIRV